MALSLIGSSAFWLSFYLRPSFGTYMTRKLIHRFIASSTAVAVCEVVLAFGIVDKLCDLAVLKLKSNEKVSYTLNLCSFAWFIVQSSACLRVPNLIF